MRSRMVGLICAVALAPALLHAQAASKKPETAPSTRFILAPSGNEARYLVREQLAGIDFPYDAVGKTAAITGAIVFDAKGALVPAESHISVDVTTLKSDRANRDRWLKTDGIETAKYPKVEFAITSLRGFPSALPSTGQFTFELVGNLTVRTATRPVTWQVTATANNGEFTGTAKTAFKFGDFGMAVPSAFMVMKLEDNLRLEYDFHFVKDAASIAH